MEFRLGECCFVSKKSAQDAVKEILDTAKLNQPLTGSDFTIVADLLNRHPDCKAKTGGGIAQIVVRLNKYRGTHRGFWITRNDGTSVNSVA